jgi:hypothetical protein
MENSEIPAPPKEEGAIELFRDDLRTPQIEFGRCAITGQWGKCVSLDLGDISIDSPDITRGVSLDDAGQVRFSIWKPTIFNNQITVSEAGLEKLLAWSRNQESPIPSITPDLVYMWSVMYTDGGARSQFETTESGNEVEVNSREIDYSKLSQINLVPHYGVGNPDLPTYTYVKESGKIYRNGEELDLQYSGEFMPIADVVYSRKVDHTWGSGMVQNSLSRNISAAHTSVLQLLGWKEGGLQAKPEFLGWEEGTSPVTGVYFSNEVFYEPRACIICIDDRGVWRPWQYSAETKEFALARVTRASTTNNAR